MFKSESISLYISIWACQCQQGQGHLSIPVTSSEVYKAQRGHPESGVCPN